jgi:hypothetical protein
VPYGGAAGTGGHRLSCMTIQPKIKATVIMTKSLFLKKADSDVKLKETQRTQRSIVNSKS